VHRLIDRGTSPSRFSVLAYSREYILATSIDKLKIDPGSLLLERESRRLDEWTSALYRPPRVFMRDIQSYPKRDLEASRKRLSTREGPMAKVTCRGTV